MTADLYFTIGAFVGGFYASIALLVYIFMGLSATKAYVTESEFECPTAIFLANKLFFSFTFNSDMCDDCQEAACAAAISIGVGAIAVLIWSVIPIMYFGYGTLRTLRFAYRIKTAITNMIKMKKCLAEYHDHDVPKIEF